MSSYLLHVAASPKPKIYEIFNDIKLKLKSAHVGCLGWINDQTLSYELKGDTNLKFHQQVECILTQPTFLSIGESPSEGSPHADLSILQFLKSQVPNRDGLSIHLETAPVVTSYRSGQHQELGEEEHMQPLRNDTLIKG